ncbi:hypothetical protein DUNSADRAFT_1509 [Dunaliella salina]|uniref:Uncharacterized protein n=1 Tax=Dunaliella salina TaxID=3046 RepID=A0ABQ7GWY2_DUNSA|nr:hypothetical protein DUNSADRAFT_1509 [Dunaliella salina]|eukprot:KAF5839111.1 hypothetical protein DUNSADRAFT_1509 [Dunaliella salina]
MLAETHGLGGLLVPASEAEHAAVDFVRWIIVCALVLTAGIASGLTLAFFSLDLLELEVRTQSACDICIRPYDAEVCTGNAHPQKLKKLHC